MKGGQFTFPKCTTFDVLQQLLDWTILHFKDPF